ncbi:MAG: hypothetical protein DWQ07_16230 [Chloroflexi bacterium]|nr:MAG: hypothetical protein DWQ07_16230 [Chloroflexota bacterium]MBL1195300.1 hypothetical protein [Chloroflexota bacterium]NOH12584.1 hypothetical protein [Chloroflexota bacterium]
MELDRDQLQKDIHALYKREHDELGEEGTYRLLDEAKQWDLSGTLANGGVVVFPHAGVAECGQQIAAAVHACLDSGAERVIVISVLHAFTEKMEQARVAVAEGDDPANWEFWGMQGPGIEGRHEWTGDHALISFRHFWQAETQRRGIKGPEVLERYPYLAGGKPELLPGIDELAREAEDAVIVSTADPFHHGIGYGDPPEKSFMPEEDGLELAQESIEEGIALLEKGDYWGYNQHCVTAKSDARDTGQVFRYIRGPMRGNIIDLTYSEAGELYKTADPTWVAAALIEWERVFE